VWRFDRDGPKPKQVISPEVAIDMIKMMNSVVQNGTGRRAELDGVPTCGKTGTTNDWRDAWFVGYTGNFVGAVWMGNDDHTSTNKMTGGTVPAMLWHEVMAFAHQNVDLKPIPGLGPEPAAVAGRGAPVAQAAPAETGSTRSSGALSRRSFEVIGGIGELLKTVERPVPGLTALPAPARAAANFEAPAAAGSAARAVGGRIAVP